MDSSGERCYTLTGLRAHARSTLAPTGLAIGFRLGQLAKNSGISGPRGERSRGGLRDHRGAYPVLSEGAATTIEVRDLPARRATG